MANIGVICGANDTISIIFNFIALAIIAEFDNYVYASMKGESFKALCEKEFTKKVLVVQHTTSKKCKLEELSQVKDEDGNFRPLKIEFKSRSCSNKTLFVLYKIFRAFYVSTFYYFMPFTCIIITLMIPFYYRAFFDA